MVLHRYQTGVNVWRAAAEDQRSIYDLLVIRTGSPSFSLFSYRRNGSVSDSSGLKGSVSGCRT